MQTLREMLADRNLGRVAKEIESATKQSICLVAGKQTNDAVTRLGGEPNLPPQFEWPTWREEPLAFVAQLDLGDLPQIPGLALPRSGALLFFFEGGENAWGFKPEDRGSSCVLYTLDPLSNFPRRRLPKSLEDHLRFKGAHLIAEPAQVTIPGLQDVLFEQLAMTTAEREAYYEIQAQWNKGKRATIHRIGGYPDPIRGDPKVRAQLVSHGIDCGDANGYKIGKKKGLFPGAADWELLLQVDSEKKAEMMWGDVGRIYFLIHKKDLQKRRFDKTLAVFQCS